MKKIFVTGATGHLGRSVIDTLLGTIPPGHISILTRNDEKRQDFEAKGFNAFLGSYESVAVLERAMEDVDTVLLISSGDQGDRMQEHKNVVDAARRKNVKHIAYTGRCLNDPLTLANKLMTEHFETEKYIAASGLNYTFFRNVLYMDAIPQFIGGIQALDNGILLPAGNGEVAFALRAEMGEAIANVLLNGASENNIYRFTGEKSYSFHDIAAVLSELTGKEVNYNHVETAVFEGMMEKRGLPAPVIQKIVDFVTDIGNNQEAAVYSDLAVQLGRKPADLKAGLKIVFGL